LNKKLKILFGIVSLIVVIAAIIFSYLIENVLPYSPIRPYKITVNDIKVRYPGVENPGSLGLSYEIVNVITADSIELKGWFIHSKTKPAKGTIILLHGIANTKYAMLSLSKVLTSNGFNCVLYDSRANGESGGLNCTFGFYEKRDVSIVLDSVVKRFPDSSPFAVYGNSLGAAVAIQSLAVEKRLRCGVVESPFATLRETVHEYFRRMFYLPIYSIPNAALVRTEKIAGFLVDDVRPEESAKNISQSVLVVHGLKDEHINWKHGYRVYKNIASHSKIWMPIDEGNHNNLAAIGGQQYLDSLVSFFNQHIQD